ncbi:MAG: Ig-like domain repeat protein, partial [Bryobacteraceae bacterium]
LGGNAEVEAVLDATWAGGVAPGAIVKFVISADTNVTDGVDLSEQYIVDNNLGDVITESLGICEAFAGKAYSNYLESVREQAAAQGMTFVVSAGDSGPYGCDDFDTELSVTMPPSVSVNASSPYVVAVGGTQFNEAGNDSDYWSLRDMAGYSSALSYIPEEAWNQSCDSPDCFANIVAGSGGASTFFPKPSWQAGIYGIPADGARDQPDISLAAAGDHDPYVLCMADDCQLDTSGHFYFSVAGGTSAATPAFAGMMALIDQKMNSRQGQVNPVLYSLAATEQLSECDGSAGLPASTCIFNDVTKGNTGVPGEPGYGTSSVGYGAGLGYDLATGLGSVNLSNLATQCSALTHTPTTTSLSITPATLAHGATSAVSALVLPSSGTGVPTGQVSLLTSAGQAVGAGPLTNGSFALTDGQLPGGSYTVMAHYAGDGTFAPSDSAPVPVTVSPEGSKTKVAVLSQDPFSGVYMPVTTSPYGDILYLSAGVAGMSGQGLPGGTITFLDNGTSLDGNPYALNSFGGTLTLGGIPILPVGQHSIVANYSGDASFNAGASPAANLTVTQAATSVFLDPKCLPAGTAATLDAIVITASFGDSPTGSVTFSLGVKPLGVPIQVSDLAIASLPAPALPAGASMITAAYTGDANYLASTVTLPVITGGGECVGSAVDGASYLPLIAPDGLASIFGTKLAAAAQYPASLKLPTTLAGTTVTVTDSAGHSAAAPLAFISPGQINCVIPPGLAEGAGIVSVTSLTATDQMPVQIANAAPAIFSADSSGSGLAAAQIVRTKPDGTQHVESTVTLDAKGKIIAVPITFYADKLVLVLYATGMRHNSGLSNVVVFLNGHAKTPFYAGPQNQFEGLDQINVNLPPTLSSRGTVDVYVTVDSQPSNDVTVVFQ